MRLLFDTILALVLIGVLGGIIWLQRGQEQWLDKVTLVHESLRAIDSKALYFAALGEVDTSRRGYPLKIDAAWFERLPINQLFDDQARPWIDIVAEEQSDAFNPARIVGEGDLAAFWYNPYRGIIRARVPMQLTQSATLDMYNLVNGTSIRSEDVDWTDPKRLATVNAAKASVKQKVHLAAPSKPVDDVESSPAESPSAPEPVMSEVPTAAEPSFPNVAPSLPKGRAAPDSKKPGPTSKLRQALGE
ncbi:hypothetical protein HED60_07760 [Planctomycetales bacterium ZRK34]|nr:hypothetical protein HED60_07760 [Planctomycetales bacterium ZRK34]